MRPPPVLNLVVSSLLQLISRPPASHRLRSAYRQSQLRSHLEGLVKPIFGGRRQPLRHFQGLKSPFDGGSASSSQSGRHQMLRHYAKRGIKSLGEQGSMAVTASEAIEETTGTRRPNIQSSSSTAPASPPSLSLSSTLSAASKHGLDPMSNRFHAPIVYHEQYSFDDWPPNHTFPMDKFERTAYALQTTCKKTLPDISKLSRPIIRSAQDFYRPLDIEDVPMEWITDIVSKDYVDRFIDGRLSYDEMRQIGFREQTPRPELIRRTILEVIGTILACQLATVYGLATNVAGGTHHASPTEGAGYTILNDLAVASNFITNPKLNNGSVQNIGKVLIADCDVHQGDGTAKFHNVISNDKFITLSIHCESNYPHPKSTSTYDIGLPDGIQDDEYMEILQTTFERVIEEVQPDFILYDAGVDIYENDRLGKLNISEDGIRRRDRYVLETSVSSGIPIAGVVGGGYDKDVNALARRHCILHEEAAYVWRKYQLWKQ